MTGTRPTAGPRGRAALLALPGVALAVAGLLHPTSLDASTAERWMWVHVVGLVVFPLVGLALVVVVSGRRDPLSWVVRVGAYLFATAYTALDVISGLAAGYVTVQLGPGEPRPEAVSLMFRVGSTLGEYGAWGLVAAGAALVVDRAGRLDAAGTAAAAVLVLGAVLVRVDHIFVSLGAVGMLLVGLATGVLAHVAAEDPQNSRFEGSSMPRRAS